MSSLAAGLVFSAALVLPAYAFDLGDHDRARQALDAGEIIPLGTVREAWANSLGRAPPALPSLSRQPMLWGRSPGVIMRVDGR